MLSALIPKNTEGLWIGTLTGRCTGLVPITCVTDKLKILSVYFSNSALEIRNQEHRVCKLEKRLNLWKCRTLSLKGKAMIINTIGASGLWYTATVLPMPEWVLWNGKTELVKRRTCLLPLTLCGLAVISPI